MSFNAQTFLRTEYTAKRGSGFLDNETYNRAQVKQQSLVNEAARQELSTNNGGFLGGIGYSLEKLGLGFISSIEGIWDYTAGGLAKLFGADDWAEQQFANDWVNYNHADEWYNPSEGWKFVGDVTGGIGTSLPAIAATVAAGAIAVASGGTLTPVAAALISATVAGLGAAGNATKQAYRETGQLTGKEFGYGALVGITEGAVEGISAGIGMGTGQIVKGISKSFGKEVAESAARQTLGKAMIKGFIGEAFEEGLSEMLDPVWARITYDPNAKNATIQEIGYAALIGGLSGAIMGGVDVSIRNVRGMSRGNSIVNEGKSGDVISMAEQLSTYESENHTGYEQFELVQSTLTELQQSLQKTNGEIKTAKQKMLLGVLEQANTTAAFTPFIARSAENIVNNAEVIAEKLTSYGFKDAKGNPIVFTAEQIRSGVDANNPSTFINSLKENSILRTLAVTDATGQLSMDTAKFKEATLRGEQLSSQVDLNRFIETASDAEKSAVAEKLGIADWNGLTNEEFHAKINEFVYNGGVEAYQQERAGIENLQSLDAASAKKLPRTINMKNDGAVRYSLGEKSIAVVKQGDSYQIYDYESGKLSKTLTRAEVNRTLSEIRKAQAAASESVQTEQATQTEPTQTEAKKQAQEIDSYARENISDYAKLNDANKNLIRGVIRQGRAAGIADADVLSYARVAARTGINVVFDKQLCRVAVNNDTGEELYSDGYYDPDTNRIVVNPETKRTHEALLIHELTHAIYKTADGKLILEREVRNMPAAEKEAIIKRYRNVGQGDAIVLMDEINAHYAEGTLTNKNILERLLADKPTFKDRILRFFKKAHTDYAADTKLSKTAQSLYNKYKKLFDSFSARNQQYNAAEYNHTVRSENTRQALPESLSKLGQYTDEEIKSIETSKLFQVARSYDDVKTFIASAQNGVIQKRLFLGKVTASTAAKIKAEANIDVAGKSIALSSDDIRHIFRKHGTDGTELTRGQVAVTQENFENIIDTLIEPDSVSRTDENGVSGLMFQKEIGGKVTAITVVSEKRKALTLKSAWIQKEKQHISPPSNAETLNRTSETLQSMNAVLTDSIAENSENVNPKSKKRFALPVNEFENTLDNLDSFNSVDEIKSYFADVHAMINDEYYGSPHTMAELNEQIRKRAEKVMRAVNLEKEAIKQYRKTHTPKNTIDLETKAQIEAIDAQYQKAIKDNDLETAKLLVEQMAIQKGYSVTDYRIDHKAPCADGSNASLDDVTSMFGEDIYGDNAARYFGTYEGFDDESIRHIQQAKGKPKGFVMAYRAVPVSVKSNQIRNGDWITLTYQYAVNHGESNIIGKYRVISKKVRISDVYTNGDSIHEFGYDDGKQYYYRDTVNYRKLADTITFDDEGNPIRLKDRFNYRNSDIRYALSPMSEEQYRFVSKLSMIEATQTENNRYSVYCENNSGLLEYEASGLNYEKLAKYFGDELAVDITYRASEVGKTVKILRDTLSPIVEKYKTLSNITPDIYKAAKKKFGTTNNAQVAGYINLDGTMLDFSGGYDYRLYDHRDISDIMSNLSGTQAMNAYIAQGNIRLMPESPSIEMNSKKEPTAKQYTTIRRVADTLLAKLDKYGKFYVEFNDGNSSVDSREYGQNTPTGKILSDIQYFYKNGALPQQSELSKFRYALPTDAEYLTAVKQGNTDEAQRMVGEAAKISGYDYRAYHGTLAKNFTEFKKDLIGSRFSFDEKGFFFIDRYSIAKDYSVSEFNSDRKGRVLDVFLKIKNPLIVDEKFTRREGLGNVFRDNDAIGVWDAYVSYFLEEAENRNADGIILNDGMSKMYVVFEPNQIKSAEAITYSDDGEIIPISERFADDKTDIRYALPNTDANGRALSTQQLTYFKDSKILDDSGHLLPVYHGSNEYGEITVFKKGKTGYLGGGIYLTTSKQYAERYADKNGYEGRIYEAYLNVTNPLTVTTVEPAREILRAAYGSERVYNNRTANQGSAMHLITSADIGKLRTKGYDGIVWDYGGSKEISVFDSSQIKLITNENPTQNSDIRYALPDDENNSRGGLTRGQRAKFVANNTQIRVYSKAEAADIINAIIDERLVFGDKYGSLSGKSRAEVIETLFRKLNSTKEGYRIGVALNIADYIIENAVLTDMFDTRDTSYSMEILSGMRKYMHGVNLNGIKSEIQYRFDKKNSINLVWGAKTGGISPDVMVQELSENYGMQFEAINEADQFFEMLEKYEAAKNEVNERVEKVKLTAYGSAAQIGKLRQQIARDILNAYDEKGSQSKFGKLVEKYTRQIESLTEQVRNSRKINSVTNSIIDSAQYLRDISSKRKYVGAEVFAAPELTSWLKQLGKLKYRSDLRKTGARQILLDYGKFYNENNPLLYDADPNLSYIDQNVLDALAFIQQNADSKKPLSLEELRAAQVIMASAKHLFQNYDQMTMEGKKVRITEIAEQGNAILLQSKNRTGGGFFNGIYGVMNKIVEPRVVIKSLENYNPNGVLTRAYNEITNGETAAGALYIDLVSGVDEYFKTHKKYSKRLSNEYITVAGAELNVGQAISLYELSKREQAREGLYESGFSYIDRKGVKHSVNITESDIATLEKAFTSEDKGFITVVEEFFNQRSKQVKTDADLEILGYTNTSEDFYFPIKRDSGTIAKNITDARELMADWANVYNFSFNKDVKAGAKNKIFVTDVFSVITRHAKQLSTYAKLTVPLKNFSQIYSKNIGDKTHVKSIRNTLNEQVWGGADRYLSKLFSDIQGRATSNSVIEKLRGAYAKYQLGANLKVIVSQITSYPTAGIMLDVSSMTKGATMKTDYAAMDQYCAYARVRNYEKGVVKAEGVIDKVGKVGDVLTKPIQWTDRATIGKLWNACQVQVQKDSGLKIGTVENMEKAGVMLEEVVRLTQPNYSNTERSELMRSDSDIVRSFTMFTSVPLKQLSRFVESVGEYKALRQMVKSGNADADIQSRYTAAKRKLRRTLGSITVANLMYVLVGQMFKWLYNKDRKDKDGNEISFIQDFFTDFVSTTIGMFPVVKGIYNYFANDYEFNNFAYETVNSLLSASKELFELATKAGSGEPMKTSDYMKPLRNSIYAIGQITGLPFRNINNTISGLIKRFDPATAYKYNSMFYNAQYSKDIKAALEKGDTELADTIMGMLLDEDKAGNLNDSARRKLIELYEKEYAVLPRSVGDSVTYNGETIKLTAKQRDSFKSVYGQANKYIEKMIASGAFMRLSEEKQAKAIKQLYDAFYDKALAATLGVESSSKLLTMTKFIQPDTLSPIIAGMSDLASDKDADGKTVQNSKKKKVLQYLLKLNLTDAQRLLLLYYSGYTVKDGEYRGWTAERARTVLLRYILNVKNITAKEKAAIAEMCGFQVKNGKIVASSVKGVNK